MMIQFYFLAILCNALAGYALTVEADSRSTILDGLRGYAQDETFRLILGVLTMATGFFKLLSAVRGDVPVLGDLLPSAAGLAAGFVLLYEFYRSHSTVPVAENHQLETIFMRHKKWFGLTAIISAAAHFLFPTVLFL
jgi:hypothetical protein